MCVLHIVQVIMNRFAQGVNVLTVDKYIDSLSRILTWILTHSLGKSKTASVYAPRIAPEVDNVESADSRCDLFTVNH